MGENEPEYGRRFGVRYVLHLVVIFSLLIVVLLLSWGRNSELDQLREEVDRLQRDLERMEQQVRDTTDVRS